MTERLGVAIRLTIATRSELGAFALYKDLERSVLRSLQTFKGARVDMTARYYSPEASQKPRKLARPTRKEIGK